MMGLLLSARYIHIVNATQLLLSWGSTKEYLWFEGLGFYFHGLGGLGLKAMGLILWRVF